MNPGETAHAESSSGHIFLLQNPMRARSTGGNNGMEGIALQGC